MIILLYYRMLTYDFYSDQQPPVVPFCSSPLSRLCCAYFDHTARVFVSSALGGFILLIPDLQLYWDIPNNFIHNLKHNKFFKVDLGFQSEIKFIAEGNNKLIKAIIINKKGPKNNNLIIYLLYKPYRYS